MFSWGYSTGCGQCWNKFCRSPVWVVVGARVPKRPGMVDGLRLGNSWRKERQSGQQGLGVGSEGCYADRWSGASGD